MTINSDVEQLLNQTIEGYKKGKLTIGELAEKTNKTTWDLMEILKQRKVQSNLTLKDLEPSQYQ